MAPHPIIFWQVAKSVAARSRADLLGHDQPSEEEAYVKKKPFEVDPSTRYKKFATFYR